MTATDIIIVASIVCLVLYDIVVATDRVSGNTLSERIRDAAWRMPFYPFAAGVLCGHWFWNGDPIVAGWPRAAALVIVGVAALIVDRKRLLPPVNPIFALAAGVPVGRILWAQAAGS